MPSQESSHAARGAARKCATGGNSFLVALGLTRNWEKRRFSDQHRVAAQKNALPSSFSRVPTSKRVARDPSWPEVVALDCEMVGAGPFKQSVLARVVVINETKEVLLDELVRPAQRVTDLRSSITGLRWSNLKEGSRTTDVRKKVMDLINGKVVVGHDLRHDLKALELVLPQEQLRDTALNKRLVPPDYKRSAAFPQHSGPSPGPPKRVALKTLAAYWLNRSIQDGTHDPCEDASAAMDVYLLHRSRWETDVAKSRH